MLKDEKNFLTSDDVEKVWDMNAPAWIESSELGLDIIRDHVNTPAFLHMLPPIKDLCGLDIGCGEGNNTRLLAKHCKYLTAIDLSEKFLMYNKAFSNPNNVTYQKASASQMPFNDNSFDFVTSTMSLMDMPQVDLVFSEVFRVLKNKSFFQFSILHPCFNEHTGRWIEGDDGYKIGLLCRDYFKSTKGEIHKWAHPNTPINIQDKLPEFQVPRFSMPISIWLNKVIEAGFILEKFCEPRASKEDLEKHPMLSSTHIVAHSLIVRCRKN